MNDFYFKIENINLFVDWLKSKGCSNIRINRFSDCISFNTNSYNVFLTRGIHNFSFMIRDKSFVSEEQFSLQQSFYRQRAFDFDISFSFYD
jgi:hypothetical protein